MTDSFGERVLDGYRELTELASDDKNVYLTFVKGQTKVDDYRVGVVDQTGREILPCEYTSVIVPKEGYLQAENENGMYLFSLSGEMIWKYEY